MVLEIGGVVDLLHLIRPECLKLLLLLLGVKLLGLVVGAELLLRSKTSSVAIMGLV